MNIRRLRRLSYRVPVEHSLWYCQLMMMCILMKGLPKMRSLVMQVCMPSLPKANLDRQTKREDLLLLALISNNLTKALTTSQLHHPKDLICLCPNMTLNEIALLVNYVICMLSFILFVLFALNYTSCRLAFQRSNNWINKTLHWTVSCIFLLYLVDSNLIIMVE